MDLLRVVTIHPLTAQVNAVLDLNSDAGGIYRARDTFRLTPGQRRDRLAQGESRYDGDRVIESSMANMSLSATFNVKAATPALAIAKLEALLEVADRLNGRRDLFLEWTPGVVNRPVFFEIRGPASVAPAFNARAFEQAGFIALEVAWQVGPLAQGLPMDQLDDFSTSQADATALLAEWTKDTDTLTLTASAVEGAGLRSALVGAGTTRMRRNGSRTYSLGDNYATVLTIRAPSAWPAAWTWMVGKSLDADDYVAAYLSDTGGGSPSLEVYVVVAGVSTSLAAAAPAALVAGRLYHVRLVSAGRLVRAQLFDRTGPADFENPLTQTAWVDLSSVAGRAAIADGAGSPIVQVSKGAGGAADASVLAFDVAHYVYPTSGDSDSSTPRQALLKSVPGNAPALVTTEVAFDRSVPNGEGTWGYIGWRRYRRHNLVPLGDLSVDPTNVSGTTQLLYRASLSAYIAAAATPAHVTSGGPDDQPYVTVTSAAAANSGVSWRILQRLHKGRSYTLEFDAYVQSGGSWQVFVVAAPGLAAEHIGTITAPAGATWVKYTVPTALRALTNAYGAEVIVRQTAAGAGNVLRITRVRLWEGTADQRPSGPALIGGPMFGMLAAGGHTVMAGQFAGSGSEVASTGALAPFTGRVLRCALTTGGQDAEVGFVLDPGSLDSSYQEEETVDVEVWAAVVIPSTAPAITLTAGIRPSPGVAEFIYTREFGPAGKVLPIPGSSTKYVTVRVGTLAIPRDLLGRGRLYLSLKFAWANAGSGNLDFAYAWLAPLAQRMSSPSGKRSADTNFPAFLGSINSTAAPQTSKLVMPDGRSLYGLPKGYLNPGSTEAYALSGGLAGGPFTVEPGDAEALVVLRGEVPDDPDIITATAFDEYEAGGMMRFRITPRYRLARST